VIIGVGKEDKIVHGRRHVDTGIDRANPAMIISSQLKTFKTGYRRGKKVGAF
jgi:hypothetical protein